MTVKCNAPALFPALTFRRPLCHSLVRSVPYAAKYAVIYNNTAPVLFLHTLFHVAAGSLSFRGLGCNQGTEAYHIAKAGHLIEGSPVKQIRGLVHPPKIK